MDPNAVVLRPSTIFVGGLAPVTDGTSLRRHFQGFGEIADANVVFDSDTGLSKGFGFVTFRDPAAAARALVNPSPCIDGRIANCNVALSRNHNRNCDEMAGRVWPDQLQLDAAAATSLHPAAAASLRQQLQAYGYMTTNCAAGIVPIPVPVPVSYLDYYGAAMAGGQHQMAAAAPGGSAGPSWAPAHLMQQAQANYYYQSLMSGAPYYLDGRQPAAVGDGAGAPTSAGPVAGPERRRRSSNPRRRRSRSSSSDVGCRPRKDHGHGHCGGAGGH